MGDSTFGSNSGTGIITAAITGTNTHTGATTISAGTLQLGNGGTTGAPTGSSGITNNANLTITRSKAFLGLQSSHTICFNWRMRAWLAAFSARGPLKEAIFLAMAMADCQRSAAA